MYLTSKTIYLVNKANEKCYLHYSVKSVNSEIARAESNY